ncbi:MAG: ribose-phosphate diphosphokinase [Thermoproteota archaeon]
MIITSGTASEVLGIKVAREMKKTKSKIEIKRFPDGEKYVRVLDPVEGEDVAVIQSCYRTPDEFLFEYFLIVDALKGSHAKKIIAVFPYFAYARQDERFKPGEALSLESVIKLVESIGTDEVYTIDMHLHRVSEINKAFNIPAYNLTAIPEIARYVKKNIELNNPVVLGPDEESEQWAKVAARELDAKYDILEKRRLSADQIAIKPRSLDVKGKDVVLIDDMISTGGTLAEAISIIKKEGASTIIAACSHAVLVENAYTRIFEAGADYLISTDTIPSPVSYVSVAGLIADALTKRLARSR